MGRPTWLHLPPWKEFQRTPPSGCGTFSCYSWKAGRLMHARWHRARKAGAWSSRLGCWKRPM
eukprot:7555138-Alexandrium_andersonii.AAC.1